MMFMGWKTRWKTKKNGDLMGFDGDEKW